MASTIQRLFLIRHATSTANLDARIYKVTPDHIIPLARPEDDPRAQAAAEAIKPFHLPVQDTCCWSSTYLRCRQTEALVTREVFGPDSERLRRRVSFLLREQEFGDWDGLEDEECARLFPAHWAKRQRMSDALGRFYFRVPNGESRADVVQRVTVLLGKIHRSRYLNHMVFLHGVTQRAFRMAWFDRLPEWFETEPNPTTASVLLIERDERGWWQERYLYQ
ncbi:MAG: histidine phosphatase family protein [Myxococcales bacterium]|nr:histidine phosphatase family protein [Polyangiaceae bacterium]MDW8249893.1 histidine phosphatase family protein [Myxococcales bacterium]